jgi:hypothetical protein
VVGVEDIIKTGIPEFDTMLGGGLLDDSTLLVIYGAHSFGWVLAIEIFRRLVESGGFGVITNYSFPTLLLERYGLAVHYDVFEAGSQRKLAVIDIFGSFNDSRTDYPFIYYIPGVDPTTFLAKIVEVYRRILQVSGGRKPIGLSLTIDGMVDLFGEETTIKILRKNIALKVKARETDKRPRPLNIFMLNRERVSSKFIAWLSQYAEHVVDFTTTDIPGVERMVVRKSLLPEFTPTEAEFKFSRGRFEIRPSTLEVE